MRESTERRSDGVLEEAEGAFEHWRASRWKREQIPERLWGLAAEAAAVHGTHRVARRLRLNPSRLKERLAQAERADESQGTDEAPAGQPAFLELPVPAASAERACVLEAQTAAGARLRIELRGEATAQAESMARILWEGRA